MVSHFQLQEKMTVNYEIAMHSIQCIKGNFNPRIKRLMKLLFLFCFAVLTTTMIQAQTTDSVFGKMNPRLKKQQVEISCGECQFKMKGKGCHLAIRINGKDAYWVDGATVDSFGDAHADDGFCNAIKKAEVQGVIRKDRFRLEYLSFIKPK
jgi:hypothetical protein